MPPPAARPGQRVALRGRMAVLAALQPPPGGALPTKASLAAVEAVKRRWPRGGGAEVSGTVLSLRHGSGDVELKLDAAAAAVLGVAKLLLPPAALALPEAAAAGAHGGAEGGAAAGATGWGDHLAQQRRVGGGEQAAFVIASKTEARTTRPPAVSAQPSDSVGVSAQHESSVAEERQRRDPSSSSASSPEGIAVGALAARRQQHAQSEPDERGGGSHTGELDSAAAVEAAAGMLSVLPAVPARQRVRHRRARMTRAGRTERLHREIKSLDGIESAMCVGSRAVSAAALHRRARGRLSAAVALLRPEAPEQQNGGWGLSPCIVARILDFLPVSGDPDTLRQAAACGDLPCVREHLWLGVDPNAADLGVRGVLGVTALHWAASGGHVAVALTLLGAKADPQLTCAGLSGSTPLHLAAQSSEARQREPEYELSPHDGPSNNDKDSWRRRQMIEALLIAGADPARKTGAAGSLRRARRRLCVQWSLMQWSQSMAVLTVKRKSNGYPYEHTEKIQQECNRWFAPMIETIVKYLPLREHTPADKALEYNESISVLSQWEQATATAISLAKPGALWRESSHINPFPQNQNQNQNHNQNHNQKKFTMDATHLVSTTMEMTSYTNVVYGAFMDAAEEEDRRRLIVSVNTRLQKAYQHEKSIKQQRRERFKRAVQLMRPPDALESDGCGDTVVKETHVMYTRLQSTVSALVNDCLREPAVVQATVSASQTISDEVLSSKAFLELNTWLKKRIDSVTPPSEDIDGGLGPSLDALIDAVEASIESHARASARLRSDTKAKVDGIQKKLHYLCEIGRDLSGSITAHDQSHSWLQKHHRLLVYSGVYPDMAPLESWVVKNGVSDNHKLRLLESCCTRAPWSSAQKMVALLEGQSKAQLMDFLETLPRMVKITHGGTLGFVADDSMAVKAVQKGSVAAAAGVKPGMQLLKFQQASVGELQSCQELQAVIDATPPPWLFRFSNANIEFCPVKFGVDMAEQVFQNCDVLQRQRKAEGPRNATAMIEAAKAAAAPSAVKTRRSTWKQAAELVTTRSTDSAPTLKAVALGDRNSMAIIAMHFTKLKEERAHSPRALPRRRAGEEQETLQNTQSQDERDERRRLEKAVRDAFAQLPEEVGHTATMEACSTVGLDGLDGYLEGLFSAYGAEVLPRDTIKHCVVKRCLG